LVDVFVFVGVGEEVLVTVFVGVIDGVVVGSWLDHSRIY
jgi:hypothetical protein